MSKLGNGGRPCTFVAGIEGRPETRLLTSAYFTSGRELNTGEITGELKAMAAVHHESEFVFEIYEL